MTPSKRFGETDLGWMESQKLEAGSYSCSECKAIFHYVNDTNDHLPPRYCAECGRRNRKAVDN